MSKKKGLDARYTVKRLPSQTRPLFQVAKYTGPGKFPPGLPEATYQITEVATPGKVTFRMCNCPNSRSGRHIDDKHCNIVADWIARGEPKKGWYDSAGGYHK